jgi:hypothetical protein
MKSLLSENFAARAIYAHDSRRSISKGIHAFSLEVFKFQEDEDNYLMIEWNIPELNEVIHISVFIDNKCMPGFDGVKELPPEAISLLEKLGYDCQYAKG